MFAFKDIESRGIAAGLLGIAFHVKWFAAGESVTGRLHFTTGWYNWL